MPLPSRPVSDIRDVGFNESVKVGGRSLHIQTEVIDRGLLEVRSTVLDGGRVLHTARSELPPTLDDFTQARAEVQARHDAVVQSVCRGELD